MTQVIKDGEKQGYPAPSVGKTKVFVVPVEFTDYPADEIGALYNSDVKDKKALKEVKAELEKIKEDITEAEFKKAVKKTKSKFAYNAETVSEIGENIGYYMTVCDELALVSDYLNVLEHITIDDLKACAKRYLNIDNATISVLLPERE